MWGVKCVNLSGSRFSSIGLSEVTNSIPFQAKLVMLNLSYCHLDDEGLKMLQRILSQVKELNLAGNRFFK